MRISLYIEDGLEQIVLKPDTDIERTLLANLHKDRDITIHRNRFYHTQGGFVSQGASSDKDYSTIIVLKPGRNNSKVEFE